MKNRYNHLFSHFSLILFLVVISLGFHHPASAQTQVLGNPSTCPLCNPPASVLQLRKLGNAVKEFPVVHLYEGEHDSVSHTMKSAKYSHLKKVIVPVKKQKGKETIEQVELHKPLGFEPYYYKDPEVVILSSSVPKALLTTKVSVLDTKDTLFTPQTFEMEFRAGTPGKSAVVWLQGSATRQHTVNRSDSSKVFFLVPIVIYQHHIPTFTQEISVFKDTEHYFKIDKQKPGESVQYSYGCFIVFDKSAYNPAKKLNPHLLPGMERNCGALAHILVKAKNEWGVEHWIETKRVLLIVKDNLNTLNNTFLNDRIYYENISVFDKKKKFHPAY